MKVYSIFFLPFLPISTNLEKKFPCHISFDITKQESYSSSFNLAKEKFLLVVPVTLSIINNNKYQDIINSIMEFFCSERVIL